MKILSRFGRSIGAGLGALALSLATAGCMEFDEDLAGEIQISTHVADWRQEIIYQVLVDRFADGDAGNNYRVDTSAMGHWHGGDWRGLEQSLPYLEELGVTTLWISPLVKNVDTDAGFDGYHGYWTQSFVELNPHFGDLIALRRLVNAAHERGMKVILDIVTNHVGQLFYYDINKNGQPDKDTWGGGLPGQSGVVNVTEYDPEFDPRGIQSRTSLGESGPAPIIFQYDPATNHVPPAPLLFQSPDVYNRKGRTFNFDDLDQLVHGDFPGGLKDVDTRSCDVKRAMVDVFARWVELTDIDGFRIDTLKHVEHEFWRYFTQRIRQRLKAKGKTNFFMFGEAFDGKDDLIGSFTKNTVPAHPHDQMLGGDLDRENLPYDPADPKAGCGDGTPITGDMLDGVFYFSQYFQAIRDVFRLGQRTRPIEDLWNARETNFGTVPHADGTGLPPTQTLVNFLDNHDVPRFLYNGSGVQQFPEGVDPKAALRNALLFLLTEDGIPCIYYGTEQELQGGNDPANREDLWLGNPIEGYAAYDTSNPTFQWIKRLTRLRRGYPALTVGDQAVLYSTDHAADEEDAGIFAFSRGDAAGDYAIVVFNAHPSKSSATGTAAGAMNTFLPQGTVLVDVLSADRATYTVGADGALSMSLPPVSGALLIPEAQVKPGL
ncbi:MAG: alpha amylase C-terminal domain-containing protein [Polyangiaceae bacterium]|nr:alpha amylase C-terminal domain-containing protein [Polyangiaceae bacterium]